MSIRGSTSIFFQISLIDKASDTVWIQSVNRPCKKLSFCRDPHRNFDKHMIYFHFPDILNGLILFILCHIIRFS